MRHASRDRCAARRAMATVRRHSLSIRCRARRIWGRRCTAGIADTCSRREWMKGRGRAAQHMLCSGSGTIGVSADLRPLPARAGQAQAQQACGLAGAVICCGWRDATRSRTTCPGRGTECFEEASSSYSEAPATQLPDFPPCFSSTCTSVIRMPRSTALHMS